MRKITIFLLLLLPITLLSQSKGETTIIQTINYSQTNSPEGRDTMINFPNDPNQSFEKIIMAYNMRCKDALISNSSNTNRGCGEWDYSCNTYIIDSTRTDSTINFQTSHKITHFSGTTYNYVEEPTYNHYQYLQQEVILNNVISEDQSTVGIGSISLNNVIQADENSGKSQYLFTETELNQAGLIAGDIDGITINALTNSEAKFLKVKIKHSDSTVLDNKFPEMENFTEVYFSDYSFTIGENRIQFYTPFTWDGTSNIIVEFSFTNKNPSDELIIEGSETNQNYGLCAKNQTHIINDVGYTDIPAEPLSSISEEITVSFWSYGNTDFLPAKTSIIGGIDDNNNRQLNIHHPWINSSIIFDCGFSDNKYDRIEKGASSSEIAGQWNHWAFTKNAVSGEMKIFLNGELWQSGADKTNLIEITNLVLGNMQNNELYYFGKIDELRLWNKELDAETIKNWMNIDIDNTHPYYDNLVANYKFNEGSGTFTSDASAFAQIAEIHDCVYWENERGENISRGFAITTQRPNITFLQGEYDLTINPSIVEELLENLANQVREYEIINRFGTKLNDSINIVSVNNFWEANSEYIFNPEGNIIDSIEITPTGTIDISELTYYKRFDAKYELVSLVTPYGINLDLGEEGKTWFFDVSDYAPILNGRKRLVIQNGGQRQEDLDIKFYFTHGTPPREVLDINQIWRPASISYTDIINDRGFEPREILLNSNADKFKLRSLITGHGQQGEFLGRMHTFNIDGGDIEYTWKVWKECSTIPIYPQGGTWIYDRAGWCPGTPTDLYEYDITEYVTAGQEHTFDYGITYASGDSRYLVNNQLVSYGPANFSLDAAIVNITKPNSDDVSFERFNPACSYPIAVIQNTGSTTLTSLDIEYYVEGNEALTFTWTGSLDFMESEEVELDIPNYSFWTGSQKYFNVNISNPNGSADEYEFNNNYQIEFTEVDLYDDSEPITILCRTNNYGNQTSYQLTDLEGNVILDMDDLENNTTYTNEMTLDQGCYKLRIDDSADDGLYWWNNSSQGSGYFRIINSAGEILYNFEREFGRFAIYEFGIADLTGTEKINIGANIISVYPNPTSDYVNINFQDYKNSKIVCTLYNSSMVEVLSNEFTVLSDNYKTKINLNDFNSGVYFLQIICDGKISYKKIVKD